MFDIVIPCHPKDKDSLILTLNSLKNLEDFRKVYIITPSDIDLDLDLEITQIHDNKFDHLFTISQIKKRWLEINPSLAYRSSWIYQQLLKIFCHEIIYDICDNYLVIDSDTIVTRPIFFDLSKFQYCIASENHYPYKEIFTKITNQKSKDFSFVYHHMMFNKKYLQELVNYVEKLHDKSFFNTLLDNLNYFESSCFSEWDLYGNWMMNNHPEVCQHRQLKAKNIPFIPNDEHLAFFSKYLDLVSSHAWLRGIEAK